MAGFCYVVTGFVNLHIASLPLVLVSSLLTATMNVSAGITNGTQLVRSVVIKAATGDTTS